MAGLCVDIPWISEIHRLCLICYFLLPWRQKWKAIKSKLLFPFSFGQAEVTRKKVEKNRSNLFWQCTKNGKRKLFGCVMVSLHPWPMSVCPSDWKRFLYAHSSVDWFEFILKYKGPGSKLVISGSFGVCAFVCCQVEKLNSSLTWALCFCSRGQLIFPLQNISVCGAIYLPSFFDHSLVL